jgi:hypothetical protein
VAPPTVPLPSVQLPSAPAAPAPPAPSRALPGSAPSAATGSSGRVRDTAVDSGGNTSSRATAPTSPGAASGGGTSAGAAAAPTRSQRTAQRRRAARERRFRRTVRELQPCLSTLPALARRVLVLRAGVGEQEVLSLAQTARRVDRRQGIVRRIERRAVRRMKVAMKQGECTGGASAIAPDGEGTSGPLTGMAGGEFAAAGASGAGETASTTGGGTVADAITGGGGGDGSGSGAGSGSGSGDRGGVKGEQRENRGGDRAKTFPGSLVSPPGKGIPAPFFILVALAGLAWLAVTLVRRRKRRERIRYY